MSRIPRRVVITGARGSLGRALCLEYLAKGWEVWGVGRGACSPDPKVQWLSCAQEDREDAARILALEPELIVLSAGAIETRLGDCGLPLMSGLEELTRINYLFPSMLVLVAAEQATSKPLTIVGIGSIADGSPSCFGPLYHASKAALHHFYTGVAPIVEHARPNLKIRLYRPGVILGPLSWAPVNRLNEKGYRIRAKRCQSAPEPGVVAARIVRWIEGSEAVGSDREPMSFLFLKIFFSLSPAWYAWMQKWAWRRASRWGMLSPKSLGQTSPVSPQVGDA